MHKIKILGLSTIAFMFAAQVSAEPIDINKLYSSWCYTEMEYKDGDRSKEKATYTFSKNNTAYSADSGHPFRF